MKLGSEEATAIVEREIRERREAAKGYVTIGREGEARTLEQQADVLKALS